MKRILFFHLIALFGFALGCKKIELDPVDGEPVFEASGSFGNVSVAWQAGVDDYYMFSSHKKDQFDIFSFHGLLARQNNDCCNKIEFVFRDARQTVDGVTDVSRAISTDIDYSFADNAGNDTTFMIESDTFWRTSFSIVKSFAQPQQPLVHYFEFGDSTFDSTFVDNINHVYQQNPVNQQVKLITKPLNNHNCSSFFTRNIQPDSTSSNCNLDIEIDSLISNTSIQLTALPTGSPPFSYLWSDGSIGPIAIFSPSNFGPVEFSVTVTDANGCSVQAGVATTLTPGTIPPICIAAFDYVVEEIRTDTQIIHVDYADSLQFSAATIIYSNADGVEYRSDRQTQPQDSFIKILAVSDYDKNEKDEPTKKISIEYSCRVWNETGEFIDIREGKAVIAVSYPD